MADSAEAQLRILIDMGYSLEDAQQSIGWVLRNTPQHSTFNTWVPTAIQLNDMSDIEMVQDAKSAWYRQAPDKYKRILDATPK